VSPLQGSRAFPMLLFPRTIDTRSKCAQGEASFRRFISKDELDAYHLDAPPNDFANPMLPAFEKRQFETIRDNGVNHDLRAMF